MVTANEKAISSIKKASELIGVSLPLPIDLNEEPPVSIYVIGQPQLNLFGVIDAVYGGLGDLNRSILCGYECVIRYGEREEVRLGNTEVSLEEVVKSLSGFDAVRRTIEICLPDERLKALTFHLLASDSDFDEVDWMRVKTDADHCLFVLSATALLSMPERKALRRELMPHMGDHLGIILTNDDLILSKDRPDIDSALERFFEGKTTIYRFPDSDEDKLAAEIEDLTSRVSELRHARVSRAEKLMLENAGRNVDLQIQILSDDSGKLDEAIQLMSDKARALSGRSESACRKMRMQYTSPLRVNAAEDMAKFYQQLRDKLHSEIAATTDTSAVQKILPDYIKDQWDREAQKVSEIITDSDSQIQSGLREFVEKDIREFISEGAEAGMADYVLRLTDMYVDKEFVVDGDSFRYKEAEDQSKIRRYGVIASGVALALLSHPIIGTAVAVFGSKKIKKLEQERVLAENKQGLTNAADEMCREVYDDMGVWLENAVNTIEKNMYACIEECYQKLIAAMVQALENKKNDKRAYTDTLEKLNEVKKEIEA